VEAAGAYRVGLVAGAREVDHAVEAGEGCAVALVAVAVELLLCEDISTVLEGSQSVSEGSRGGRGSGGGGVSESESESESEPRG
jgi:hypothetical protein